MQNTRIWRRHWTIDDKTLNRWKSFSRCARQEIIEFIGWTKWKIFTWKKLIDFVALWLFHLFQRHYCIECAFIRYKINSHDEQSLQSTIKCIQFSSIAINTNSQWRVDLRCDRIKSWISCGTKNERLAQIMNKWICVKCLIYSEAKEKFGRTENSFQLFHSCALAIQHLRVKEFDRRTKTNHDFILRFFVLLELFTFICSFYVLLSILQYTQLMKS